MYVYMLRMYVCIYIIPECEGVKVMHGRPCVGGGLTETDTLVDAEKLVLKRLKNCIGGRDSVVRENRRLPWKSCMYVRDWETALGWPSVCRLRMYKKLL